MIQQLQAIALYEGQAFEQRSSFTGVLTDGQAFHRIHALNLRKNPIEKHLFNAIRSCPIRIDWQ